MDMARTMVNVLGNCMASIIVGKWEKAIPADAPLYTGKLPPTLPPTPTATATATATAAPSA